MLRQGAFVVGCLATVSLSSVSFAVGNVEGDHTLSKGFRSYPLFAHGRSVIEAAHDKGLMIEFIVRCPGGSGILTFSKVERVYCLPDHHCEAALPAAVSRLCK